MLPGEKKPVEQIKLPESDDYDSPEWEEFSDRVTWEDEVFHGVWEDNGGYIPTEEKD